MISILDKFSLRGGNDERDIGWLPHTYSLYHFGNFLKTTRVLT